MKTITVKQFSGTHIEVVPVMRNGKPTKRTKEVRVYDYEDVELVEVEVEGHKVYVEPFTSDVDKYNRKIYHDVYNENGKRITGQFVLGCGTSPKEFCIQVDSNYKVNNISITWYGVTGRNYNLRHINW